MQRSQVSLVSSRLRLAAAIAVLLTVAGGASACTPSIGDQCVLSTDCSTRGDRLCDTSQPSGYCTQFNCSNNSCPDKAACVLFNAAIQGCGFDDRAGQYGSRAARAFCVGACTSTTDCRSGYLCADPRSAPWNGHVLDDNKDKKTCLVIPADYDPDAGSAVISSQVPAPVCSPVGPKVPPIDASAPHLDDASVPPPVDAGAPDADAGDAADGD